MSKAGESILRGASEALSYARGDQEGFVAHVPEHIDVRAIGQNRARLRKLCRPRPRRITRLRWQK